MKLINLSHSSPGKKRLTILVTVAGVVILTVAGYWLLMHQSDQHSQPATKALNPPQIGLNLVVSGFKLLTGIVATNQVDDQRLFILDQSGVIRILNPDGTSPAVPFLDISERVLVGGEMGLLGLAFHPRYQENGFFYVNYVDKAQNTVIARYQTSADANLADPASEKLLLNVKQPYDNHNGGDLQFGADGYLYIALGDGGAGGDPENRAQNLGELLGKILRIDVDHGEPYAIPSDNPFINQPGVQSEIWAYGLRNPWRISFDKQTGGLLIADVGQNAIEEIDYQPAGSTGGQNYGWRCFEGSLDYNPAGCSDRANYVFPILEYSQEGEACSVTGGYVYRGSKYPALIGKYFYGDFCNGQLLYAEAANDQWQAKLAAKTPYQISTFGQATNGELYLADYATGSIYQIIDTAN